MFVPKYKGKLKFSLISIRLAWAYLDDPFPSPISEPDFDATHSLFTSAPVLVIVPFTASAFIHSIVRLIYLYMCDGTAFILCAPYTRKSSVTKNRLIKTKINGSIYCYCCVLPHTCVHTSYVIVITFCRTTKAEHSIFRRHRIALIAFMWIIYFYENCHLIRIPLPAFSFSCDLYPPYQHTTAQAKVVCDA